MLHTPLHGAHWLWYGGRALGTNRYRDCSTVIAIGREELPVEALEDYGRALWGIARMRIWSLFDRTQAANCACRRSKFPIRCQMAVPLRCKSPVIQIR